MRHGWWRAAAALLLAARCCSPLPPSAATSSDALSISCSKWEDSVERMVPALRIRGGGKFPVSKMMNINTKRLHKEDRVAAMDKVPAPLARLAHLTIPLSWKHAPCLPSLPSRTDLGVGHKLTGPCCGAQTDALPGRQLHKALPFLDEFDDKYTVELKAARNAAAPKALLSSGGGAGAQNEPQGNHDARAASRSSISIGGRTGVRSREAASIVKELTFMLRKAMADGAGGQHGRVSISEIGDVAGRLQRVLGAAGEF